MERGAPPGARLCLPRRAPTTPRLLARPTLAVVLWPPHPWFDNVTLSTRPRRRPFLLPRESLVKTPTSLAPVPSAVAAAAPPHLGLRAPHSPPGTRLNDSQCHHICPGREAPSALCLFARPHLEAGRPPHVRSQLASAVTSQTHARPARGGRARRPPWPPHRPGALAIPPADCDAAFCTAGRIRCLSRSAHRKSMFTPCDAGQKPRRRPF
jgi:hypothetical protein